MVGVALTPQPGANYINIADETYKRVDQLRKILPEDITLNYAYDSTINIRKAISI